MSESNAAPASSRPRPAILVLVVAALAGGLVYMLWPAATTAPAPSNPPREQRRQASAAKGTAGAEGASGPLHVKLDALKHPPASPQDERGRNPFRFYVPPPPPPPAPKPIVPGPPPPPPPKPGDPNYQPPPPPPIPLKFIGVVEKPGKKVAVFVSSDGKGMPLYAAEGELILGQYRVVKIGVESVTVEYLDGRGRQTIPMRG